MKNVTKKPSASKSEITSNNTEITLKPNARQPKRISSELLWTQFTNYFASRKISLMFVIGEFPKGEKENTKAHFVWYMDKTDSNFNKKMFLYISPRGNICLPKNDAQKIGLIHVRDYNIKGYSTHEFNEVLVTESKYYTNFTELLDKLVDLHEIGKK